MNKRALIVSGTTVKTFNSNNVWADTGLAVGTLTDSDFITYGFDPTILNTTYDNILVNFNYVNDLDTDGNQLWVTDDIDKNLGLISAEYVDGDTPKVKIYITAFLPKDSLLSTDQLLIYSDDVAYVPEVLSTSFSASSTHSDTIIMTSDVLYLYNKQIVYKVKVNDTYLSADWSTPQSSLDDVIVAIAASYLSVGNNAITIEVADADTKTIIGTSTITNAIELLNNTPAVSIVSADSNSFKVHFIINDLDTTDQIKYRLTLVNSKGTKEIAPWTDVEAASVDISYSFNSDDVVVNEPNTFNIEYKDNLGLGDTYSYTFTGQYQNLLFMDELGNYYSTDKEIILNLLHMGKLIMGRTSASKQITLINNNGYQVSNILLTSEILGNVEGLYVELSKSNNPFTPLTELDYGDLILNSKDTANFYVRLRCTDAVTIGLNNFKINAFGMQII